MITTKSRWVAIACHTLLAIVVMQLCRLLYFFYNQSFFPSVDGRQLLRLMQGGYILDIRHRLWTATLLPYDDRRCLPT